RVVRLKSGDPSIFGRATEELDAARALGIPVEIVPGVTAASAAAASLGRSLTERGATDTLVLSTGTCRPGDPPPDWAHHFRPGTTLAIYMGVRAAGDIARSLMTQGACATTQVEVVANSSHTDEQVVTTDLARLAKTLKTNRIDGVALILLRMPKAQANQTANAA
ncbi:MAG: SAM-dependent methyltransferase, partial [Pseudomonadota bacterium]